MSRALTLALVQLEVEDEKAAEAFLVAAHISLLELKDTLLIKGLLVEEEDGPKGALPVDGA